MTSLVNHITKRLYRIVGPSSPTVKSTDTYGLVIVGHRDSFRPRKRTVDRIDTIYFPRFRRDRVTNYNVSLVTIVRK